MRFDKSQSMEKSDDKLVTSLGSSVANFLGLRDMGKVPGYTVDIFF